MSAPRLTVVGSVNLDLVASAPALPAPGETVTGARLARHPGGKGANQALAARRLGAEVALIGRVGSDAAAGEALALLREAGVDLSGCTVDTAEATGVALIAVDPRGENQIVVASGANAAVTPADLPERIDGALLMQLELPVETVAAAAARATGFVGLNTAPALPVPDALLARTDLIVANRAEAAAYGERLHASGLVAVTLGAEGAELWRRGACLAKSAPPPVTVVDATGAGDAFTAALCVALLDGRPPEAALRFALAAGALTCTRPGAQPSLPRRAAVEALLP